MQRAVGSVLLFSCILNMLCSSSLLAAKEGMPKQEEAAQQTKENKKKKGEQTFWDCYNKRSELKTFLYGFLATEAVIVVSIVLGASIGNQFDNHKENDCGVLGGILGAVIGGLIGHNKITPDINKRRSRNFIINTAKELNLSWQPNVYNINIKHDLDADQLSINATTTAMLENEKSLSRWGSRVALLVDIIGFVKLLKANSN